MDREEELKQIELWEKQQVEILINTVDDYCKKYQKIRQITLNFIKELEKAGLKVEDYSIERKK